MLGPIKRWSFSRLLKYEACPHAVKLQYIEGKKELPRPSTPDKGPDAATRGKILHKAGEEFILDKRTHLIPELRDFSDELKHVKKLRKANLNTVEVEAAWAFDVAWNPVNPQDADRVWLLMFADLFVLDKDLGIVIDHKSGKRRGNELKHADQTQLYQLCAFLKYPQLQKAITELWYLDLNELIAAEFTRKHGMRYLEDFNRRALQMTTQTIFEPKPSQYTCRFCPFRTGMNKWVCGSGDCGVNPPDPTEKPEKEWLTTRETLLQRSKQ